MRCLQDSCAERFSDAGRTGESSRHRSGRHACALGNLLDGGGQRLWFGRRISFTHRNTILLLRDSCDSKLRQELMDSLVGH